MANNHRRAPLSLSLCLPALLLLLLLHHLCSLDAAHADGFHFPTGGMSTGWRSTPSKDHVVNFDDWSQLRSPLLRRSREGFGPTYACGFYCSGENGCDTFYFSIFIVQTNRSGDIDLSAYLSPPVVWTANRGFPVGENATLQLGSDGDLVLTDWDGTKVWSTNTSGKSVAGMNLTEYGNLVLFRGDRNETIWDSFAYPTDSLVPGQKLMVGQSLKANTNSTNWTEGPYYLSATPSGLFAFSKLSDPPTRYGCLLPNSSRKVEYFEFMNGSISTSSTGQYMPPSQFFQLGAYGALTLYEWTSTYFNEWKDLLTMDSYCTADLHPTAGLSSRWTSTPRMEDILIFTDGSQVRSPLLRQSREVPGPTYACGFYCRRQPCDSFLFSIFIVYIDDKNNIALSVGGFPQVVWTANRGHPVGQNATLQLGSDGDLVLTDADRAKVWSTNTSGKSVAGINLTECGNLVLFGGDMNQTIWNSFASSTDTLVPGQKLYVGQTLKANDSATNWAAEGLYYLSATSTGLIASIKSDPPARYASLLTHVTGEEINCFEFINGSLSAPSFAPSSEQYVRPFQFLRLDSDGHLRVYEWRRVDWVVINDLLSPNTSYANCFYPTVCGRYGVCSAQEECGCPGDNSRYNYFLQVDSGRPTLGCVELIPLSCQRPYNHSLLRLDGISYFTYAEQYPDISQIDEDGCRNVCANRCACKAAFFRYNDDISNGECFLTSEVFSLQKDKYRKTYFNSTAFIKVQNPSSSANGMPRGVILGSSLGAFFLLLFIICCIVMVRRKVTTQREKRDVTVEDEEDDLEQELGMPRRFSLGELGAATNGFCKKLGKGGFGSVYEGSVDSKTVAVKGLDGVGQGRKEFLAEVKTLGRIHHVNLVKLIGYCAEKSCRLLVYEFMPNGSLDRWIFSKDKKASLDWQTRCRIIHGVAKGLSYLHEECSQRIAHLDIKPQNILLDDRFEPKVSDFGLAKLIEREQTHVETRMRGTPGYMAPEWLSSMITEKADVYSFGVVILEIICGRRNLDRSQLEEDVVLVSLLKKKAENGELADYVKECIKNTNFHVEEVMKMIKIAMWCLQDQNHRPSMSTVVKILEGAVDVESNLEGMFWTSVVECSRADAGNSTPLLATLLSGPR